MGHDSVNPTPLVDSRQLGDLRIHAIQAGGQRLDGGAMFGVVPKPLWERRIPADDRNRIQLGMRCLLVEHPCGLILVDTGAGNKEEKKFRDIYGIENEGASGRTSLEDGLREVGARPEDIAVVINTHLHFDHAGGFTERTPDGTVRPRFPRAQYIVRRGEFEDAMHPNERTKGSYFLENYKPLADHHVLQLVDDDVSIVPGVRVRRTGGHTMHHQMVLIESAGKTAVFAADLLPTAAHLPEVWVMGYDLFPLDTLNFKRAFLREAVEREYLILFEHDPDIAAGYIRERGGKRYIEKVA